MQMNVLRSISQGEVVADLCSCDEEGDFERHCLELEQTCLVDDDEDYGMSASISWVKSHCPEVTDEEALDLLAQFEIFYRGGNTFADALEWSGIDQNTHPAVRFCRKYSPYMPEQECYEAYETYRSYRDEGQSDIVSRQYAGLL